jgi:hypothetical protein
MAVGTKASGSQTATIGTEHTLLDTADSGIYRLKVSLVNLANEDIVELRYYDKVRSGDSYTVVYYSAYANAQGADGAEVISPALECPNGAKFTLKQTSGTGRAFPWAVTTV